jgi:hypothetical protein
VYAVEASGMAHYARQLAAANPGIGDRIKVLHGKVEEIEVPEKVGAGGEGEGGNEGRAVDSPRDSGGQHSQL